VALAGVGGVTGGRMRGTGGPEWFLAIHRDRRNYDKHTPTTRARDYDRANQLVGTDMLTWTARQPDWGVALL